MLVTLQSGDFGISIRISIGINQIKNLPFTVVRFKFSWERGEPICCAIIMSTAALLIDSQRQGMCPKESPERQPELCGVWWLPIRHMRPTNMKQIVVKVLLTCACPHFSNCWRRCEVVARRSARTAPAVLCPSELKHIRSSLTVSWQHYKVGTSTERLHWVLFSRGVSVDKNT